MPNPHVLAAGGAMPAVTAFYEITPLTRRRIESAVESLLALLDEMDGDADLEAGEDDEDGYDAEHQNEDGDPCDDGEPDDWSDDAPRLGFHLPRAARRGAGELPVVAGVCSFGGEAVR